MFLIGSALIGLTYSLIVYTLFLAGADGLLSPVLLGYASQYLVSSPLHFLFGVVLLRGSKPLARFIVKADA